MSTAVKLDVLMKKYDNQAVVDNLSLEIKEGEIFGLLGPNGAGKSTTMNMICSLIKPKLLIFEECDVMETRKIGLVGGTGPESTVMYYKELNSKIDRMSEGKVMPDIAIESVNFRKAWDIMTAGDYESLSDYLSEKVNALKVTGSEVIALTAVTMHVVYDAVQKKTGVPLVSIPKAVSDEAAERGFKKVGLLGTIFTMEQDFMKNDFLQAGIEVVVPDSEDRQLVARRIYEELEFGIVKESTLKEFNDLILKMQNEHGIEAVVLGCTELPLLLNNDNCVLPCLDSVAIHINEVIELAISDD